MSLLWYDPLDYRSANYLSQAYPGAFGFTTGQPHPRLSRTSIQATFGAFTVPANPPVGFEDQFFVGFYLQCPGLPSGATEIMVVMSPTQSIQLRLFVVPTSGGRARLEVRSFNGRRLLLRSSELLLAEWRYIELNGILQSSGGTLKLWVDGVLDVESAGLQTQNPSLTPGWRFIQFSVSGANGTFRFADLYVADARSGFKPLGPVAGSTLYPFAHRNNDWSPSLRQGKRLVILAGQRNINGVHAVGSLTYPTNPQPKVRVWNRLTSAWQSLQAGVNSGNFFLTAPSFGAVWGPEMSFAHRVAQLYASSGDSLATEVYILKAALDIGWVWSAAGPGSWHPSVSNGLMPVFLAQLSACVQPLGGWNEISSVHLFWHQGESEGLILGAPSPVTLYREHTKAVLNAIQAAIPKPLRITRCVLHEGSLPALQQGDAILGQQRFSDIPGDLIETSELPLLSDRLSLSPQGSLRLGELIFQRWIEREVAPGPDARFLKDYFYQGSVDNEWLGTAAPGTQQAFSQIDSLSLDLMHSPVAGVQARAHLESQSPGNLELSIGDVHLPPMALQNSPAWTTRMVTLFGKLSPDELSKDITIRLS